MSENGPQFSSAEFQELAKQLDFVHITSSPHHPQGNAHIERAVQIAKRILKQTDPMVALMCYRSTPCAITGVSPAELLMGWKPPQTKGTVEIQPTRTDTTETVPSQNRRETFPTPKPGLILTRSGRVCCQA